MVIFLTFNKNEIKQFLLVIYISLLKYILYIMHYLDVQMKALHAEIISVGKK